MIDYLNQNQGAITGIASILMFIITLLYVIINSLMHSEMVKSRKNSEAPNIVLKLESEITGFYKLVITNNSKNDAYNIKFTNHPGNLIGDSDNSNQPGFIKYGISYMAPEQSYESFYINFPYLVQNGRGTEDLNFELKYENKNQDKFTKIININLSLLTNNQFIGRKNIDDILKEIKKIRESIEFFLSK
ncbi:hypothetical protein [Leptospira meyeri]|uniref:hypothetical protein n=1 Tax=Leptospira meyeri TaxID=29508 RepID=UPI00223E1E57|nr:hypothetical protein [Leptospira meyeri]MCW7490863.1 hypothetical protein [Leptospira meyeri]